MSRYEEIKPPRFTVETVGGQEQITLKAPRNLLLMAFLAVWLCGWTFGGLAAMTTLWAKGFQPFLMVWLGGWALGEGFAAATLCWSLTGAEILRVVGSDLEIAYRMLGFTTRKLFRGSEIRHLSTWTTPYFSRYNQSLLPFFGGPRMGSVKFAYGARTVFVAPGLDEPEAQLIVDRLQNRLPLTATDRQR
jgi:hypothetical protein